MEISKESENIIHQLESLASPVRLEIFRLLVEQEPTGLVSGEIAEHLDQPHNGISFHLKSLQHAGLVTVQREGRYQRYRADMPVVRGLVAYLTENCCRGTRNCSQPQPADQPLEEECVHEDS
ncbi:metalloregulator ArsR/SmtB family transcription factor [Acidithiobacillus montserratensis]|uniref:Metalloregulator ArsR/SmtB family transcription factor n=1 Tax=Acidithiobacillus montserratensis TaxID=2729135 RepID=A0ACD5HHQ7_9PROT|nr:metalloregulator ArsR/SmtB family transcription factor [Acidithiobacillus montserratensis]MBN2680506.1 helix-turn-helix transcriptional regulator [Acidithiobacillaceae bacterium]MBU2746932.1 helix-turn-helix transcriptional regulator [Acidithiobacillus montserratensis]